MNDPSINYRYNRDAWKLPGGKNLLFPPNAGQRSSNTATTSKQGTAFVVAGVVVIAIFFALAVIDSIIHF